MRDDVVALYVMSNGHYPELVTHWFDETRDAKLYNGPWPVVAHPPCGPWGRLKFLCTKQDPTCGPHAAEQVRRWGGVLEHPQDSTLFRHCNLPRPGELPDAYGGRTVEVRQVSWGHPCVKKTWLYFVGISPELVRSGIRHGGRATHRVTNGSRGETWLPRVSAREASLSPLPFAQWLVELAATAVRP